jgi:hypothetical protein
MSLRLIKGNSNDRQWVKIKTAGFIGQTNDEYGSANPIVVLSALVPAVFACARFL